MLGEHGSPLVKRSPDYQNNGDMDTWIGLAGGKPSAHASAPQPLDQQTLKAIPVKVHVEQQRYED